MMLQLTATVQEHVPLAERTFRIRLHCPGIAQQILPGQFVMLRLPGQSDPLLGRPFALYDTSVDGESIDVVYLVMGKMTGRLSVVNVGESLVVWGPLGQPFPTLPPCTQVTLVAGGIGQTPFLAYAQELLGIKAYGGQVCRKTADQVVLYYGVRTASLAADVSRFENTGVQVQLCSDDGSIGRQGYVTQALAADDAPGPWVGCGPEPMLHALANLAEMKQRQCYVSLETPMACGIGICFSCVTKVKCETTWDYKRVCVDGPVFAANQLIWD